MGGRQPGLAQEYKLSLLHAKMPIWKKTNSVFLWFVFVGSVYYTCSGLLCCFCHVESPIPSVLDTGAQVSSPFQAASGHIFCCQDSLTVSVLVPACLANVVDQVPVWHRAGVQVDYTTYWYFAFSAADISQGLGLILWLWFWHQGITHGMLLLTWVCSKSRQQADNGRLSCLLFLVTIFS